MEGLTKYLIELSQRLGMSDPAIILLAALGVFIFCVLIIFALRTTVNRGEEGGRINVLISRLDALEKNLTTLRGEVAGTADRVQGMMKELREEMGKVRGGGGPGGSSPSGSSGPSGPGGGGGGTRGGGMFRSLTAVRNKLISGIKGLFGARDVLGPETVDELEAILIGSDIGVRFTTKVIDRVREQLSKGAEVTRATLMALLNGEIAGVMNKASAQPTELYQPATQPYVILMVGVNGVGKTTTTAKLARWYQEQGKSVLLVAADTFRAAAVEQLTMWGDRLGIPVCKGAESAKPATVVFDAMAQVSRSNVDVIIIDTAGRLHTKGPLMQELEGIRNAIKKSANIEPHETLLVVDGSTGQNALEQAREFKQIVSVSGLVVTKLDGTPRGGIVVAIADELGIPVRFVGLGERAEDLEQFDVAQFVESILEETPRSAEGTLLGVHSFAL